MPKVDFCFQGWVRGAEVKYADDVNGLPVDVSEMSNEELVKKLRNGELFVSLGEYLYDNDEHEIELSDYDVGAQNGS